jgi:hypothetical protein
MGKVHRAKGSPFKERNIMAQKEKQLQNLILRYLNNGIQESFAFEIYSGGLPACARGSRIIYKRKGEFRPNGVPDVCWVWKGITRFIETKTKKGVLSKEQKEIHAKMRACGAEVYVIKSLHDVYELTNWENRVRL